MKMLPLASAVLVAATLSVGQNNRPVKMNLLAYFDKVPVPPLTSKEAHAKCECNDPNNTGACKADGMFKAIEEEMIKIQTDISSPAGTTQGDLIKKMQDPAFQKEMEKMSDAEKMNLAMRMQQSMTPKPMGPEPATVMKALEEFSKLNEAEANSMSKAGEMVQATQKREQELDAKHKAIDQWQEAEIKKLPIKNYGEMSAPDPKDVYTVTMNAWHKHISVVDDALKLSGKLFADKKAKAKKQYAPFQAGLEKTTMATMLRMTFRSLHWEQDKF